MNTNLLIKNPITNILSKPRILGPAVFVGVGTAKTMSDYQKAENENKTKVLLKDTSILAGSVMAFTLVSPLTRVFCNTEFVRLFLNGAKNVVTKFRKGICPTSNTPSRTQKIMENTEHVLKEAIAGTINTFAGILGAVYANEFLHKYVLSKPPFITVEKEEKSAEDIEKKIGPQEQKKLPKVFYNFDYVNVIYAKQTANRVFSTVSDLPEMKILTKPMVALTGFSVANTKGYHNKLKKTTYELLANTLIPTIFVSAVSLAVQNKKASIKYPALISSLLLGAYTGVKAADNVKEKLNKTIDGIDMKYMVV